MEEEAAGLPDDFGDAEAEKLPLLNAVIMEGLRLYTGVPGSLPRAAPKGGSTLGGYHIRGGMEVSTQSWTLHRNESLFPNPEKYVSKLPALLAKVPLTFSSRFDVSGWLPGSNPLSDAAKAALSPFSYTGGFRVCLGYNLALMELRFVSAEFFHVCRGAKLAPSTTPDSMQPMIFFLIMPNKHWCEIIL